MADLIEKLKNRLDSASDAGASIVEWILIMVLAVGLIAGVGVVIANSVNQAGNNVNGQINGVNVGGGGGGGGGGGNP